MDSLSSEGFELDFSHLYALHWYFILKIVSWDILDPTIMNQLPLKKNHWMSTIYPSQAIINLVFLTYIYTSTYVLINHLLIYLRLRVPVKKMMHIITK